MPTAMESMNVDSDITEAPRASVQSKNVDANSSFVLPLEERKYSQQYANLYYMRLEKQRKELIKVASKAWDSTVVEGKPIKHVNKVLEVNSDEASWIVGTVYKEMKYKPNILDEVTASHYGLPPVIRTKYIGDSEEDDQILLEDESGRVRLVGEFIQQQLLVTGVVIAVLGSENSQGDFHVIDIKVAGFAPQAARFKSASDEPRYLALASGLMIGAPPSSDTSNTDGSSLSSTDASYSWHLLQEFLTGELGDAGLSKQIVGLVLAGDSVIPDNAAAAAKLKKEQDEMPVAFKFEHPPLHEWPVDEFDALVGELVPSIPVTVMPGSQDPTTDGYPQQPFHHSLFTGSKKFAGNSLTLATNPYWLDLEGVKVFGTSGQPIDDIYKYVKGNDRISMMEATLQWQHCAPTAPDTLWSYPYLDQDPFVLEETPHIYFAGNQPYFDTHYVQDSETGVECRIISLPKFSETSEIVLVDLNSLECRVIKCA